MFRCPPLFKAKMAILFVLFISMVYFAWPVYGIQLISNDTVLKTITVEPNSEVYIDYIHSVAKAPVRDVFIVKPDATFLLTRTEYNTFGAGLPTDTYGDFKQVDGVYINSGIDQVLPQLPLRVGRIADHRLTFEDGTQIIFSDYFEGGSLVIIKPVRIIRLQTL